MFYLITITDLEIIKYIESEAEINKMNILSNTILNSTIILPKLLNLFNSINIQREKVGGKIIT